MAATICPSFGFAEEVEEGDWKDHAFSTSSGKDKDLIWKEDPSKWWDNRSSKRSPRYPDFKKHRTMQEPLSLDSQDAPSCFTAELRSRGNPCRDAAALSGDRRHSSKPQKEAFLASIRACTRNKDLVRGISIHNDLVQLGLLQNFSNALVIMYTKCGELGQAKDLLDMHKSSCDVVTWTALMTGYAREGRGQDALDCFEQMQREGILPDAVTYACILKACAMVGDAEKGGRIHDDIARQGLLQNDVVLGNALIDMYVKCGDVSKARQVLDGLPSRNVVSWNALIAGYAQTGLAEQALHCFEEMQCQGILPDAVTFLCILKACTAIGAAEKGKEIHDQIVKQGLLHNSQALGNALVDMYAKCGAVSKARQVLLELPSRNVVSWNALITGYTQEGDAEQAIDCFEEMQRQGIFPDAVTYACILKACATIRAVHKGKQIHDEIVRQGLLQKDIVLGGALVDMYAKCGAVSKARQVLNGLPARNVVSWSALIAGYIQEGDAEQALNCFENMQREGVLPNAVTYACILKACAMSGAADKGKQIHEDIESRGWLQGDGVLGGALVDMYAKCGAVSKARQVLDALPSRDVASWNALIAGYAREDDAKQALDCFEEMQREGIRPDAVTFLCILKVCAMIGKPNQGSRIHDYIARQGLLRKNIELGGALVDMYVKCGAVSKAREVFDGLPCRDVVSWSALIAGYTQEGEAEQALSCFEEMKREGILPNAVTFTCILRACAMIGAADKGEQIHDEIARQGLVQSDSVVGNALVDMYAKCGAVSKARRVLDGLPDRNVVSWNALMAGYAQEGDAEQALDCLEEMQRERVLPDVVTCACVLNVCSHRGLLEEGQALFVRMTSKYDVNPDLECYICMVDLFGRAGHLEKAVRLIQDMPSSDYSLVWHSLLGACQKWADVNVGRWAFEQAVKLDRRDGLAYVLLANI